MKKNWPGVDQLVGKHDELNCADIGHCPFLPYGQVLRDDILSAM